MAKENFVAFFNFYLPQHPDIKKTIEEIVDPNEFVKTVLTEGHKAGFDFNDVDCEAVLRASVVANASSLQLNEEQLEAVVGGALSGSSIQTIEINTLASTRLAVSNLKPLSTESTWMCSH